MILHQFRLLFFSLLFLWSNFCLAGDVSRSVIHGAQLFQNNCSSCHSLKYLVPTKDIPAFPVKKTPAILGVQPPDLSLEINIRGADWVYAYLDGFYPDSKRPLGTNNKVYPDTAMPNMLAGLKAQMTPEEFHGALNDIVTFLTYAADPHQDERKKLGYWVVGFLIILALFLWLLFHYGVNRDYDVNNE